MMHIPKTIQKLAALPNSQLLNRFRYSLSNLFIFYCGFLFFTSLLPFPLFSWEITTKEVECIGQKIFMNECSGKTEKLVWWNDREDFASLGIGHFIWYPKEKKGLFEDTFPALLAFLETHNVCMPIWLKT